jgi:hypothetical protein
VRVACCSPWYSFAISATSEGTSAAPARPLRSWAVSMRLAVGLKVISTCAPPNRITTARKMTTAPNRWFNLAPSMTKPATASEYITIPVATVVGGTLKLFTMPLSATGSEATLKDISAWPRAIAIIGTQDSRCPVSEPGRASSWWSWHLFLSYVRFFFPGAMPGGAPRVRVPAGRIKRRASRRRD